MPRDTVNPNKCFENVVLSICPVHGFHLTCMWIPLPGNLLDIQALSPLETPAIPHSSSFASLSSCHRPENSLLFFSETEEETPCQMWRRERPETLLLLHCQLLPLEMGCFFACWNWPLPCL